MPVFTLTLYSEAHRPSQGHFQPSLDSQDPEQGALPRVTVCLDRKFRSSQVRASWYLKMKVRSSNEERVAHHKMKRHEGKISDALLHLAESMGTLLVTTDRDLTPTSLSHKRKELAHVT